MARMKLPSYIREPRPTAARSIRRIHGIHFTPEMAADLMIAAAKIAITVLGCLAAWGLLILLSRLMAMYDQLLINL